MRESLAEISRKILFVDDEVLLLEGIKRQLRREFDITLAEGGEAALNILRQEGPFAVVVSDYNMPKMDGITFLHAVHQTCPQSILIMLTGRAELDLAVNALHRAHISRFLNKPCPKELLVDMLNDSLEQYRLRMSEQLLKAQLQQANQQLQGMNDHLEVLVAQKTRALQLQYRYVASMTQIYNPAAVIGAMSQVVAELTGIDDITIWLSPQQDGCFTCHHPLDGNLPPFQRQACAEGVINMVLQTNKTWLSKDGAQPEVSEFDRRLFRSRPLLCLPLQSQQGLIGLLNLGGDEVIFGRDTLEALMGMADVTATALQSHWHRQAFADAQDAIITSLAKLSEYRDPETGSHLLRLKKYCALMCGYMANTEQYRPIVTAAFTDDLVRSSPLHDIGKVGIPDAILKKPGRLTVEEFEVMKSHALIGGDTLRSVYEQFPSQNFIKCGMDVAYAHHERWDGSGYPLGLKAEAIPLSARILALVDVYDALTCRRVYKAPFSREQANAMIVDGSGNHFDPNIVAVFLELEAGFHQIAEKFADL